MKTPTYDRNLVLFFEFSSTLKSTEDGGKFFTRQWTCHFSARFGTCQMFIRRRMKQFFILLFSIIVGEWIFLQIFSIVYIVGFSVFSLYRSLSADETARNENEVDYELSNVNAISKEKNELKVAQERIKQLENRILELEQRLPKKYETVKFLNYQSRKRILVSQMISVCFSLLPINLF